MDVMVGGKEIELKDYGKIESTSIDYKEKSWNKKPKSWLKSVSAFANTNGGILLFGISDKDKIKVGLYDVIEIAKNLKIKSIWDN